MKYFLFLVLLLTQFFSFGQITEDFSDGDFSSNPTWSGTTADYIINPSFELQLNNSIAGTSYLSTAHGLATLDSKEWSFWTKQSFSPSSGNYGRVYLTASNSDLTTDPDGFYLQLGEAGTADAIRLFKCQSGVHTELLAGTPAQIATSFEIGVRVVRDASANWSVFVDDAGGTNYVLAGTVNDATALLGTHFGFFSEYTVSNSDNFYHDDIYIGDEIVDTNPPVLVSATAVNANQIDVLFDEAVDQATAETLGNYDIQPFLSATSALVDGTNPALVHLVPTTALINGSSYTLFTDLIEDLSGNPSTQQSVDFMYLVAENPLPGDIAINEFLCDPTPQVGLADAEFVELYNLSSKIFNVQDWKLGDATSDGTIQNGWLLPGEYIVLTATANVDSFTVATAVTSFPSLNNSGDNIVIRDNNGVVLDSITYSDNWYNDENKDGGGYTIERINPNDPCTDFSDWSASNDALGGTPGAQNSIFDSTPDTSAPALNQLIALAPNYLEIYFTEGMDSLSLVNALVSVTPTLTIQNIYVSGEHPSMFTIQFNENFIASQVYNLELDNVSDCWLNTTNISGNFALPETAVAGDIIINEILFDPLTGGSDWVELYNNSNKLIDLFNWELATFDDDTIGGNAQITTHFVLYPGEYVVITEDENQIIQNYPAAVVGRFIENDVPSYTNDSSTVYIIQGNEVIDRVAYTEDWHFQILDNTDGKSLERLDPNGISTDSDNWHTAAEAIGFGTPGGENSQLNPVVNGGNFTFESETISPDNDGYEDKLQVNYQMEAPGMVGKFVIYDDRGRLVKEVFSSELLASEGVFTWDGIRTDGTKASIGTYIAIFEAYDIQGAVVFAGKKAFVVAGKL